MGLKEDAVFNSSDQPPPLGASLKSPKRLHQSTAPSRGTKASRSSVNQNYDSKWAGFFDAGFGAGGTTSAAETLIKSIQDQTTQDETKAIEEQSHSSKRVGLFAMFHYATRRECGLLVVGTFWAAIAGLAMPTWLLLLSESLATFNQLGSIIAAGGSPTIMLDEMYKLIYSFAVVGGVTLVSGTCYVAIWSYVGEMQTLRIRKAFVKSALRQESAWFDTLGTGNPQELPVLASNALFRIQTALGRSIADLFSNLISAVGCLMVSLALDPPLALFMICVSPIIGIAIGIVSCFMRKKSGLALKEFASAGAFASEVLSGIKTVASLRAEKWAVQRYTSHANQAQKYSVQTIVLSRLASGIMGLLFYITYTFSFVFGTYQAAQRAETEASLRLPFACFFRTDCGIHGSEVMVCIYGVILCAQFIALMNPGLNAINLGRTAAAEIYGTIERLPEIDGTDETRGAKLGSDYDGSIELRNVFFAYPTRPTDLIFTNFNLKIQAGTAVALVGPSGSGKSTASKLLLRLYDPIGGHILAGGVPLTEMNLKWWRSQIGYVPQEPSLFPGTIRDNIAAGNFDGTATDEEVKQAARSASAHDFIMDLPEGYDTFYSGSSIQLSGGQIQRVSIARALIRNPKILLLDEATSALDTQSERIVQDALDEIRRTRKLTTFTVAHRLSTIVHSDQIVVIADGSIQEAGTHKELVEEGGIYATLCEGQGLTADAVDRSEDTATSSSANIPEMAIPEVAVSAANVPSENRSIPSGNVGDMKEEATEEDFKDSSPNTKDVNSRLRQYSKPETGYSVMGHIGGIAVGALPACEAILFGLITGNFFTIKDAEEMRSTNYALSLWFLLLAVVSFIGNIFLGVGFGVAGSRLTVRMRELVFDRLMRWPVWKFDYPENSTGELITILEEDSEVVSNVTGLQQGQRIQVFSCLVAGMVVALAYSWQIGIIAICCVPFILGASILQAKFAVQEPSKPKEGVSAATLLERAFHDIVVLQAFGIQDDTSTKYADALEPDIKFKKKQGFYNGLTFGISQFSVFSTFALIFYVGVKLMFSGELQFTDFFVALLSVMFSAFGAGQTGADFSSRRAGLEAAARLFEISDDSIDDEDDPLTTKGNKPNSIEGKVAFQNCHFAYPTRPDTPIYYKRGDCDGFSLDIESRQSVAFTGRSGCGKSTALQILLRFYRVNSGSVELDGKHLTDLNLGWLRDQIGYVGQMPVLFQGSIRDNIRLGKPNATEEEIVDAAKAANCHDFIMQQLSEGYDTNIGVGGSLLSGGQRQRCAIARAIVKNPKLLVLDEATAALDTASEKIVQAALDKMQKESPRTTLIVAHRLETIKKCDKIVVLDRGCVKEEGSHSELLNLKGLYHTLWTKQGGGE